MGLVSIHNLIQGDDGVTLKAPTQGWDHCDLPVYCSQPYIEVTRTPTRSLLASAVSAMGQRHAPEQSSTWRTTGAIAGGAAGGGVLWIIFIAAFG